MKSVSQLRQTLEKQWQSSQHRISRLLDNAFPITLSIGKPTARQVNQQTQGVKTHIQSWQDVERLGVGEIIWAQHHYRSTGSTVRYPEKWRIPSLQAWHDAIMDESAQAQMRLIQRILSDDVCVQLRKCVPELSHQQLSILLRHFSLVTAHSASDMVLVCLLANLLTENCAHGLPIRALSMQHMLEHAMHTHEHVALFTLVKQYIVTHELDSKFLERHQKLLCFMLSIRFGRDIDPQNFHDFLHADKTSAHWLLCTVIQLGTHQLTNETLIAPANALNTQSWLPFSQIRVRDTDLMSVTALPFDSILIVENESCLHHIAQSQRQLCRAEHGEKNMHILVILGAGNNLSWLQNTLWQQKRLFYWGDIDTWGFAILSQARQLQPHIQPIMMDAQTLEAHQSLAVTESSSYPALPTTLTPDEQALFCQLQATSMRLEQEFLALGYVEDAFLQALFSESNIAS